MATAWLRRLAAARGPIAAVAGAALASTATVHYSSSRTAAAATAPPPELPAVAAWHKEGAKSLPIYTSAEVAAHSSMESGVWVTFGGAVYDITEFIKNHPGGVDKILTAAGGSVEPFWRLYRQHLQPHSGGQAVPKDQVAEQLAPLQVGWLDPVEAAAAATAAKAAAADDPYGREPERHPALRMLSATPCSAEVPATLLGDSWLTPSALWFVRNHHPVPDLSEDAFSLEVRGPGAEEGGGARYTLEQLRAMPRTTVTTSLQCGGNRRGQLNEVRKTSGNAWGIGAISTAEWTGVRLRDVLAASGVATEAQRASGAVAHVQFEGDDGTRASIPVEKAVSAMGDVVLAYEMNGEALPRDHGHPLRVVVPGYVGVRNIKWLTKVVASPEEAEGVWQRGMAYKSFGPHVTSLDGIDVGAYAPIQEMPVQSAIFSPPPGYAAEPGESLDVKGFAWSGGGRGIVRVDVSADDGATWHTATLTEGADQPRDRAWAWTFWEAELPAPRDLSKGATLVCKAVDASHNTQPESVASIWNLRGLANNAWHRVPICQAEED